MLNELYIDVENQKKLAHQALLENKILTIEITDFLCATCFRKYAISVDETKMEQGSTELNIHFEDASAVVLEKYDFLEYQFHFTKLATEIEEKYADHIDELREAQQEAMDDLIAN